VDIVGTESVKGSVTGGMRLWSRMMTAERAGSRAILSSAIRAWLLAVALYLSFLAQVAGRSDALKSAPFLRTRRCQSIRC